MSLFSFSSFHCCRLCIPFLLLPYLNSLFPFPLFFLSILSSPDGCVRAWRPLGEFGGVAPTVSCYFSNQQQPQQHGVSSSGGSKSCERCHTARSAARATHYSHSKQRGWWDGGQDVSKCFALCSLYFELLHKMHCGFWILMPVYWKRFEY